MGFQTSSAVRFFIVTIVLAVVLFVFEDALVELVLGTGTEQTTFVELLEIVVAFVISFLAVSRAFQMAPSRLNKL